MEKITIITHVHNPGEYIYPCVDSVLCQTFLDFKHVIVDNASSDGTKEVLEEYARKDSRIRLYRNEDNSAFLLDSFERYVDTEYFMVLDHDDYLEPDALEALYSIAEKHDMDIVFGRSGMVNEKGEHLEEAGLKQTLDHMEGENLVRYFPGLYWQLRTIWGKLIRRRMIQHIDRETYQRNRISCYGGDTVIVLGMAFAAKRMGTVGKIVHHYRILQKSQSRVYNTHRFVSDWLLLDMGRRLLSEAEGLTYQNELYLYRVYCNAILDTLRTMTESQAGIQEKCDAIREMITKEQTEAMYRFLPCDTEEHNLYVKQFGTRIAELYLVCKADAKVSSLMLAWLKQLYADVPLIELQLEQLLLKKRDWVLLLSLGQAKEVYHTMSMEEALEICPALYVRLAMFEEKDIKRMAQILFAAGQKDKAIYEIAESAVLVLAQQNKLLRTMEEDMITEIPEVIAGVCAGEYVEAANCCLEYLAQEQWQKSGGLLTLAIALAAILENAELFVMLKKCECEFLLQERKQEQAQMILRDLEEMCPGDPEVELLKQYIKA